MNPPEVRFRKGIQNEMQSQAQPFEWHYIGRFGPLGPLSLEQMEELVRDEVIQPDTYVWRGGMADWTRATEIPELARAMPLSSSPPMPAMPRPDAPMSPPIPARPIHVPPSYHSVPSRPNQSLAMVPMSTRSRIAGGVLNLFLPGVGRMYLGYVGTGVLQLLLAFCFGIGALWSLIDGILMLTGSVRTDGMGRPLKD